MTRSDSFDGLTSNSPVIVFDRPIPNVNLSLGYSQTDDPAMARQFTIPKAMTASVTATLSRSRAPPSNNSWSSWPMRPPRASR